MILHLLLDIFFASIFVSFKHSQVSGSYCFVGLSYSLVWFFSGSDKLSGRILLSVVQSLLLSFSFIVWVNILLEVAVCTTLISSLNFDVVLQWTMCTWQGLIFSSISRDNNCQWLIQTFKRFRHKVSNFEKSLPQ